MPGFIIGERKQSQFFTSIKRGDDPRRPTAEPSAAGIEQNGPPEVRDARYARAHALSTERFEDLVMTERFADQNG